MTQGIDIERELICIDNIKKILKKYVDFINYNKLQDLYNKEYNCKIIIKNPKTIFNVKYKDEFTTKDICNGNWGIKLKEQNIYLYDNKEKDLNLKILDEKYINLNNDLFMNNINETSFLLGNNNKINKYLNNHEPFSCVISGVQGSGKSYTTNKILECCMLQKKYKCSTLICYYDTNQEMISESAGLGYINNKDTIIFTSPSNYFRRKNLYQEKINVNINVIPLLFDFKKLTVKMLKILMNIKINDTQLYMQGIINVLRKNCKKDINTINNIKDFENEIKKELKLDKQQILPLTQRLELIKSFLIETDENKELLKYYKIEDLFKIFKEGKMIIVDLTDDLIDSNYANELFRLIVDIFKSNNLNVSKLLILDEAHKYLNDKENTLNNDIIDIIRMQRHYGIRTIISTQNPCILNKEIIELTNFILLHRFSSPRWYDYIKKLYNIKDYINVNGFKFNTFDFLLKIDTGTCILICPKQDIFINLKIEKRITKDFGSSVTLI